MFTKCELEGVVICTPKVFADSRGYFKEISRRNLYAENGIDRDFVQINMSYSSRNVLRGLHYQLKFPQAKLVSVAHGEIYDVIIDCRKSSKTFGKWIAVKLSAEGGEELFVPEGFAHGFHVKSETAAVVYQCSDYYHHGDEFGVNWTSKSLAINWGDISAPIVSDKDIVLPDFADIPQQNFPD